MDLISVTEQISKIAAVQMHVFPLVHTESSNCESATETSPRVLKFFKVFKSSFGTAVPVPPRLMLDVSDP